MALVAGKNARIYISGYDISGDANKYTIEQGRDLEDTTTFAQSGHNYTPMLLNDSFNLEAFFDRTGIVEIMNTLRGTTGIVCLLDKAVHSSLAWCGSGVQQESYTIDAPVAGVLKLSLPFKFHDFVSTGIVLQAKGDVTANGEGVIVDDGASSSDGATAYLQVFMVSTDDSVVVSIRHSSDNFAADDDELLAFTSASAVGAEKKSVTGTVKRYVRAKWVVTGADVSIRLAVCFCRG